VSIAKLYHDESGTLERVALICQGHGDAYANPKPGESEDDTIRRAASQIGCTCKVTDKQLAPSGSQLSQFVPFHREGLSPVRAPQHPDTRPREPKWPTYRPTNPPDVFTPLPTPERRLKPKPATPHPTPPKRPAPPPTPSRATPTPSPWRSIPIPARAFKI